MRVRIFHNCLKLASEDKNYDTVALRFWLHAKLKSPQHTCKRSLLYVSFLGEHFLYPQLKDNIAKVEASKTPDEFYSFLLNYIKTETPEFNQHLVLFSIASFVQNKIML